MMACAGEFWWRGTAFRAREVAIVVDGIMAQPYDIY
jgi:hypothetical protein